MVTEYWYGAVPPVACGSCCVKRSPTVAENPEVSLKTGDRRAYIDREFVAGHVIAIVMHAIGNVRYTFLRGRSRNRMRPSINR